MIGILSLAALMLFDPPPAPLDEALRLLDQLDTGATSVDYHDEKLEVVIEVLGARLKVPLVADWNALERLGVRATDRVTFRAELARGSTIMSGLALALGDDLEHPVIEAHAGQIVLTTVAGSGSMRLTAAYDVRDLLANEALVKRLRDEAPAIVDPPVPQPRERAEPEIVEPAIEPEQQPDHDEEPASPARPPGIGRDLANLISNRVPVQGDIRPMTPGERLLMLVTDHVDPEAWMNFGGDRGLIGELDGVILVTAPPSTHRRLRHALQALRGADPNSLAIHASIVDLPRGKFESLSRQAGGDAGALAGSIAADSDATALWLTNDPVALDERLEIQSAANDVSVEIALMPAFDKETGALRIAIEASTAQGNDRRSVKTTVSIAGDQNGAVIQMPAAKAGNTLRILILSLRRQ